MPVNFCGNCGNRLSEGESFCPQCGTKVDTGAPVQPQTYQQPVQQYQQPAQQYAQYQQPYQQPVQQYQQPQYAYDDEPARSPALAVTAFILSFIIAPVGLILGIIGVVKYKKKYRGFCTAAIAISASITLIDALMAFTIIPPLLNYTNSSRMYSANSQAASVVRAADSFLTAADNSGYGMKPGCTQEFDVVVKNGEWIVSAADFRNFNSTGSVRWGSEPDERREENSNNETDGETKLAEALKDWLYTLNNASIHIVMKDGECTAAALLANSTKTLTEGTDYPAVGSDGRFKDPLGWQRTHQSSSVGLSPLSGSRSGSSLQQL